MREHEESQGFGRAGALVMSGRGIGDLGDPPSSFRVDLGEAAQVCGFETIAECAFEDAFRAWRIEETVSEHPNFREALTALADKLWRPLRHDGTPESLASRVYMRGLRIKVAGHLWQLVEACGDANVRFFTIIPRTWEFTPEELQDVDPSKLMTALRAALYEQGAGGADGWIISFLHGEWDPIARVFRLHVHGFAYGEMVQVIDRLRKLPNYRTQKYLDDGALSPVYRRVVITRTGLTNLPRPITYLMQSFWPARAIVISEDGKRIRERQKRRITEPFHTQVLFWKDKWKIADLTLMVGLRVTKEGLIQTKPVS